MKKVFICILIILMVLPMCAFAAKSPTTLNKIYSIPTVKFEVIDNALVIRNIEKRLPEEELEDYLWCELLYVELDKEYDIIRWYFPEDLSSMEMAKIVIIGEDVILQDASIEDNAVIIDFTNIKPGNYYICFFLEHMI